MKQKKIFSSPSQNHRLFYLMLMLLCAAPLWVAHYLQTELDLTPCPLCIVQRYDFWLMGLLALLGLLLGRLPNRLEGLGVLAGLVGAGVAVYHLWILAHPSSECVKDSVEIALNHLPTARYFPQLFAAGGSCTARLPLVLGLQIPSWSLIGLLGVAGLWLIMLFAWRRK